MTAGIGHNKGPWFDKGRTRRKHYWRRAQAKLMPRTIPMAVVRMRIRRAGELGLDYKTYASIRQVTGQDVQGLLFSSNALGIIGPGAEMPPVEARALSAISGAQKLSLVYPPNAASEVLRLNPVLDAAKGAPDFTLSWSDLRQHLRSFLRARALAGNRIVIVGAAPHETEWSAAARAAGYVRAEDYFASV